MMTSKKKRTIVANIGTCPVCNDKIQSLYRHNFVMCSCGRSGLDGGLNYVRVIGGTKVETLYDDDDFATIREYHHRGGRGKNGDEELKWVPLKDMSNKWLETLVESEVSLRHRNVVLQTLYEKELNYRDVHGIFIDD